MEYIVIENHSTEFLNPIILKKGDAVIIEKESSINNPLWFFCTKTDGSNKGWVPKQIIKYKKNCAYVIEDYSAKELDINKGAIVEGIKELNGWVLSKNKKTNEIGWVPKDKLK